MTRSLLTITALLMFTLSVLAQSPSDPNEGSQLSYSGTSGYTFSWWGKAGRNYFIQHSEDLTNWSYVPMFEQGADQLIQWGFASSANLGFLRLEYQTDGNILPDSWLYHYFGLSGLTLAAYSESPGDSGTGKGWTLEDDFFHGTDPTKNDTDGDGTNDTQDQYPLDPNRSQDVPVTQLAAINISGSNTDGNNVWLIALDDSNNAAFAYDKAIGSGTNTVVVAWANGSISTSGTVPNYYDRQTITTSGTYYSEAVPSVTGIDAAGTAHGELWYAYYNSSDYDPESKWEDDGGMPFKSTGGSTTPIDAPAPYQIASHVRDSGNWFYTLSNITSNDSYAAYGSIVTGTSATPPSAGVNFGVIYISGSDTYTVFDPNYSDDFDPTPTVPGNVTIDSSDDFTPYIANDKGWAIGIDNSNDYSWAVWHADDQYVDDIDSGYPMTINNSNQVLISGTDSQGHYKGNLWENGTTKDIHDDLLPDIYKNQIRYINPKVLSNQNPDNHNAYSIKFTAENLEGADGNATWVNRTFILTTGSDAAVSGSNAKLGVLSPQDVITGGGGVNSNTVLSGTGTITTTGTSGSNANALVQLPVHFKESSPSSGFDGHITPQWLMVPESGTNSALAYTPASTSLTATFTIKAGDSSTLTVSPTSTTISPQTITVSATGYTSGSASQIAVAVPSTSGTGGELQVDVKQYQLKTVAIHEIIEQSGTNTSILAGTTPTESALQTYLNQVYGPQTNTYFYVYRQDYTMDYSTTGVVTITNSTTGGSEVAAIRTTAQNTSFDINLYYVNSVTDGGDSTGYSFPSSNDAVIGSNSGSGTNLVSAHELGHLFGLRHPESSGSQSDSAVPSSNLMHHKVSGTSLDHLQWDIVNPYNPHSL